jgi:hypothetical protein
MISQGFQLYLGYMLGKLLIGVLAVAAMVGLLCLFSRD